MLFRSSNTMALVVRITALKGIAFALSQDVEKMKIKPSRASQEGREFLNKKSLMLNSTTITVCNYGKQFKISKLAQNGCFPLLLCK